MSAWHVNEDVGQLQPFTENGRMEERCKYMHIDSKVDEA